MKNFKLAKLKTWKFENTDSLSLPMNKPPIKITLYSLSIA